MLDADLLAITSVTNGDDTAVTSSQYVTQPRTAADTPFWAIDLRQSTSVIWREDSNGSPEGVIEIAGLWGFREFYPTDGWLNVTTVVEVGGLNASDITFTLANALFISPGNIIRIDDASGVMELMIVIAVSGNDITVRRRGENGSTAATHANGATVYVWQVQDDIIQACRMIVSNVYRNRFANNPTGTVRVTGAGVVIAPEDVPASAQRILENRTRI
jgi:hypothetical protein